MSFLSRLKLSLRKSGMKSRVQTMQLMNMARITKLKSGTTSKCFGTQRKRTRLATVSVMIFAVLIRANFRALFSCLSRAKRMAVTESIARIPPIYIMQDSYPS